MVYYRRDYTPGATYFFTLTLQDRRATYLTQFIRQLGEAFRIVRQKHPFHTEAIVVLPDHLHFVWKLPNNDCDYSTRIRLIKTKLVQELLRQNVPLHKSPRGQINFWQRRFWEHLIRDEKDLEQHINYIHYNPVKHGYVQKSSDWQYSSIHRYIKKGIVSDDWAWGQQQESIQYGE